MNPERAIAYRKQAAVLLEALLDNTLSARSALNSWPMEGNQDPSVQCAYTILWFFEADQDTRHHSEAYYADLQVKLLLEVSSRLKAGETLPPKLLAEYQSQLAPTQYTTKTTFQMGFVRFLTHTWQTALKTVTPWLQK